MAHVCAWFYILLIGGSLLFLAGSFLWAAKVIFCWIISQLETDARKAGIKIGALMALLMFTISEVENREPKSSYGCPPGCVSNHSWGSVPHQTNITICREQK